MTKYKVGDIECSAQARSDELFQGHVVVAGSLLDGRKEHVHLCPEIDNTREDAVRRAMNYANVNFPAE